MPLASYITFAQKLPFPQRRERVAILLLGPDDKVKHVHWAEGARRSVNVSLASIEGLPGSSSFVTVHNHPSGVLRPSPKDLEAASQIARASQLLRLKPRAHLIYAKGKVARFGPTITVRVEDFPGETGAHTLKQAHELAKSIRKDGEKYPVALKRAWAQLREEGKAHFPGGHGVAHMQDAHTLAKRLRKSGEPYKDALKRAWAHLRQKPGGSTGVDRVKQIGHRPGRTSAPASTRQRTVKSPARPLPARISPHSEAPGVHLSDIPMELAVRAHSGTSHFPDQRGSSEQHQYVAEMQRVWEALNKRATTDEERAKVRPAFKEYRDFVLAGKKDLLGQRAGLISTLIAGPANFNVRRADKKNAAYDNAVKRYEEQEKRRLKRAMTAVRPFQEKTISSGDPEAVVKLQAKIDKAKVLQATMKAANSIIRRKGTDSEKITQLVKLEGITEVSAAKLLEKDFIGRLGFPAFATTNNLANIKRMEARIVGITRQRAAPEAEAVDFAGGRIEEDKDANRIRIIFDAKPEAEVRSKLKRAGFRWSPSEGAWQRQLSADARRVASSLVRAEEWPAGPTRGSADVPKASNGIPTTATGPDPTKEFSFNIRVVDLAELIPSHTDALGPNPDYPKELQPRIRERAASRLQIDEIARNLEPKALVADSGTLDRGMPIVGPDMVVESGNGRVLALRRARAEYPARWKGYAAYVRYTARSLYQGLPRDTPDPVLVRVRTTNADRVAFTAMANEAATLTMSPLEQALQDSGRISDLALASLVVGESQSVDQALQAASNRQIVGHFIGNLAANERAALVGAAGELNTLGLQRLKAALFAKVYPGEAGHRLTKAFVESLDPVVKNMEAAMFDALAASAKAEGLIRAGDRVADLSLGEDVAKAVDMLARLKQTGTVASDYIRQTSAFGRELDPSQERLLVFLEANGRSRKVLREFLQEYAAAVVASPHPSQGSIFGGAGESKDAVVSRLIEAQTKKGSTGALFNLIAARQAVGFADPLRRGHWGGVTLSDIDVGGVHRGRTSISAA